MALTLESIYKPVNDYFLERFKNQDGSPIFFRFDKIGSVISYEEFVDADEPEKTVIALQRFSKIVNFLPIEEKNGLNIIFSGDPIDRSYYLRLLASSIPVTIPGDPDEDNIISAFTRIKADAERIYENYSLAPVGKEKDGSPVVPEKYRLSLATPENWYDKDITSIWTKHSLHVNETVGTPGEHTNTSGLFRLKVDDVALQKILPLQPQEHTKPIELLDKIAILKATPHLAFKTAHIAALSQPINPAIEVRDHRRMAARGGLGRMRLDRLTAVTPVQDHVAEVQPRSFAGYKNIQNSISKLDLRKRYEIEHFIKDAAPTQPSTTNNIVIDFEYCMVKVERPWFSYPFIQNNSWYIPGATKGELSTKGEIGKISSLPIGFVVVKNLSIEANWSDLDKNLSGEITDFGPFAVRSEIVNNKLSFEGIQIIGWLLQKLPDLPPNNPPQ